MVLACHRPATKVTGRAEFRFSTEFPIPFTLLANLVFYSLWNRGKGKAILAWKTGKGGLDDYNLRQMRLVSVLA